MVSLLQAATATVTQTAPGISVRDVIEVVGAIATATGLVVGAYRLGVFSQKAEAIEERSVSAVSGLTQKVDDGFGVLHKRFDTFDAYVENSIGLRTQWEGKATRWDARHDATEKESTRLQKNIHDLRSDVDGQLKDHERRINRLEPRGKE